MKKMLLLIACCSLLFLTGCWVYGSGQTTGYVYAVDDGIIWDKIWFKSSLESSQSDCYLIQTDNLKDKLRNMDVDTQVTLHYKRHLITMSICPEGTGTNDEITSFEIVNS